MENSSQCRYTSKEKKKNVERNRKVSATRNLVNGYADYF